MECRAGDSRVLLLLGAACVLSGLVFWGSYEHGLASTPTQPLVLYVPPAGLRPVGTSGAQTGAMPSGLASPVAPPSVMTPTTVDSLKAHMPIEQPSIGNMPQFIPLAVKPSESEARMGPLQGFFWGLSASFAIGFAIMMKKLKDGEQTLDITGGSPEDSVELGRAGVPTMMADTTSRRAALLGLAAFAPAAAQAATATPIWQVNPNGAGSRNGPNGDQAKCLEKNGGKGNSKPCKTDAGWRWDPAAFGVEAAKNRKFFKKQVGLPPPTE